MSPPEEERLANITTLFPILYGIYTHKQCSPKNSTSEVRYWLETVLRRCYIITARVLTWLEYRLFRLADLKRKAKKAVI